MASPAIPPASSNHFSQYMAGNPSNGVVPNGNAAGRGFSQPGQLPLSHIDDITALPTDVNSSQSIKRLLEEAEASLRQAEFGRMLNAPKAFKSYIRAYVIAVQYIPKHQDYPTLKQLHGPLLHAHQNLLRKIQDQQLAFEKIKLDIVEDNKRTGVLSQRAAASTQKPSLQGDNHASHQPAQSPKKKPAVHPKPLALHGNSLANTPGHRTSTSEGQQDLLARFQSLRVTPSQPAQDPRIKTHPLPALKPVGPRVMPSSSKARPHDLPSIPQLPKVPDAIYSPVRTTATGEDMGDAPVSASRTLYNRPSSSASVKSARLPYQQTSNGDYFTASPSSGSVAQQRGLGSSETSTAVRKLAEQEGITPEDLYEAMKDKSCTVFLIDLRTRGEYNEGHILHSAIICIEPDLLLRDHPSAEDLADSIGIYADHEYELFQKRDQYDLVVFYDQSTETLPTSNQTSEDRVINSLHRALVLLNYGHELRYAPKLLKGGLDAWVDLMGSASLFSSSSATTKQRTSLKRDNRVQRRLSKYSAKPLKPVEVEAWRETIRNDDFQSYHRSEQDFLRRFPSISGVQESMTSPVRLRDQSDYGTSHKNDLRSELPSAPSRPKQAVSRPSYSGYVGNNIVPKQAAMPATTATAQPASSSVGVFKHTGLINPGQWCYANSALQCLLASDRFGREFINSTWKDDWHVPRKQGETMDHPQLMTRIVSNLFHWMDTGSFPQMKAKTLMDYCQQVCVVKRRKDVSGSADPVFGDNTQQDTEEFVNFLFDAFQDETNKVRDRVYSGMQGQPQNVANDLEGAIRHWSDYCQRTDSISDKYWTFTNLVKMECGTCGQMTRTYDTSRVKSLGLSREDTPISLESLMLRESMELIPDFRCDKCASTGQATRVERYARMPSHLVISLKRYKYSGEKILRHVHWNLDHVDFGQLAVSPDNNYNYGNVDIAFQAPFGYECYAVIIHQGSTTMSGHYWAYVRDSRKPGDKTAWVRCNDSVTETLKIRGHEKNHEIFGSGAAQPYVLFFRRL